ncbi:SprB repeat-containing protein [Xanthocytophaga flava]|uniref:SprB repeat-containing protein n=1 Tax=Xanthocytophaga flava TaxID=3048013 RepID=UPI0028D1D7C4|nr:SprB repeat-containing protein [Xanthocytophaga flavus]MDJ1472827.1 SprB repeat-containing protein [Xanthocytophaga flavus]
MDQVAYLQVNVVNIVTDAAGGLFSITVQGVKTTFLHTADTKKVQANPSYYYKNADDFVNAIKLRIGNKVNVYNDFNNVYITAKNYGWEFEPIEDNSNFTNVIEVYGGSGTALAIGVQKTDVTIRGGSDGTVVLTPTGGNAPYTYKWSDPGAAPGSGPTTKDRYGLKAGVYKCTLTDAAGITFSVTVTIIEPQYSPIVASAVIQHAQCYGSTTGALTITPSGGDGNYTTYKWSDGPTTKDRTGLRAGVYSLTITDSTGNTGVVSWEVKQNEEIKIVATVNEDDVTLQVTGGKPGNTGYTYSWSDGSTLKDRTDLPAGSYIITVTDSIGCTQKATVRIQSFQFYFSKNPIPLQLLASDPATKPNLTFLCEVWVEKDYLQENFVQVAVLEQPADSNGSTTFEVQTILDAQLKPYLPEGKETIVSRADSVFKRFYLRYTEKFGSPAVPGAYTQADIRYVLLGGLSFEEYSRNTFFTSYLPSVRPFFSWEPVTKEVFSDQPEYLYYMPDSFTLGSFQINCQITFTDGTTHSFVAFTVSDVKRYELYCIPAGFAQLGLDTKQPAKTVQSWQINISGANSQTISQTRYYTLKSEYVAQKRYFLYLNSLGGYNTLCVTGKSTLELEPQSTNLEKIRPVNYKASAGEITTVRKYAETTLKITTQPFKADQLRALSDFVISESVILFRNNRYLGGVVEMKTAIVHDETSTDNSLAFEFTLPKSFSYTPDL